MTTVGPTVRFAHVRILYVVKHMYLVWICIVYYAHTVLFTLIQVKKKLLLILMCRYVLECMVHRCSLAFILENVYLIFTWIHCDHVILMYLSRYSFCVGYEQLSTGIFVVRHQQFILSSVETGSFFEEALFLQKYTGEKFIFCDTSALSLAI